MNSEFLCFLCLTVFTFANIAYTLWLAKHTGGALAASAKAMKLLERRQDVLHSLERLLRGQIESNESHANAQFRLLAYRLTGNHELGELVAPRKNRTDGEPLSKEQIDEILKIANSTQEKEAE